MGAEVIVNGRERAASPRRSRRSGGAPKAKLHPAAFDLGSADRLRRLHRAIPEVDILVNNLGIYEPKPFFEIEDADWRRCSRSTS